jgi:E3 ubiquitin-protein ligase SHPRH
MAQQVRPIGATLIITPPSILQQWESELARHAPTLKVFHYEGIKKYKHFDESQLLEKIATQDVVLTTYRVLAAEIHYAVPPPTRKLRRESTHQRPISPLMYFSWWRCILDEAQMIENGVTNAATVARLIPRKNAWGVTGTPVKKDAEGKFKFRCWTLLSIVLESNTS